MVKWFYNQSESSLNEFQIQTFNFFFFFDNTNMISALSWIPRGAAKQKPEKLEMSEEEYDRIAKEIGAELDLAKEGMVANEQHIMDADNDDDDDSCSQSGSSSSNEEAENGSSGERMEMVESVTEVDEMAKYNLDSYDNEETALTGTKKTVKFLCLMYSPPHPFLKIIILK